ncbi:MAG: extracellular solute-binding protein, partial [Eubacteriales bacterium]|nr:extracellular solute-binding protein [Eubacteriales bacterium]
MSKKRSGKIIAIMLAVAVLQLTFYLNPVMAGDGDQTTVSSSQVSEAAAVQADADEKQGQEAAATAERTDILDFANRNSYEVYSAAHEGKPYPDEVILIKGKDFTYANGMEPKVVPAEEINSEGAEGEVVVTAEEGIIEWTFEVENEGMYNIALKYFPVEGKGSSIEREIYIDNEIPFNEARSLVFNRVWTNGDAILSDSRGNEYRPQQIEAPRWREVPLTAGNGFIIDAFRFYLSEGEHTLMLNSIKEPMAIEYLKLYQEEKVLSYNDVSSEYQSKGYKETDGHEIRIQGEDSIYKSDQTLYPVNDRTSPATDPYNISKMILNASGGTRWKYPKQWMTWEFEVPEDGLYKIAIRALQNFSEGTYSSRKILIDGKVPFKEVAAVSFQYSLDWQMVGLGDGDDPYLFYLTKGRHTLMMENSLGEIGDVLADVQASVAELNYIYRKILMITGAYPDPYRDYRLEENLPECIEIFARQAATLEEIENKVAAITGGKGTATATIDKMVVQLKDFVKDPDTIPERLDNYRINVSALANWILTAGQQPLTLDYVVVSSPDRDFPPAEATWLRGFLHELGAFFYSFIEDYSVIGDVETDETGQEKSVLLWMGLGRDQAQTMKAMIDDSFTPVTGIRVNLRLVDMGILLAATAAGKGPDLALYQGESTPVNYALRNALYDLTQFDDIDEVLDRFADSAVIPFMIRESVYAIPEQQTFVMMFYRKDILQDLEIDPPQTWRDVYKTIPVLQRNYLDIGFPAVTDTTIGGPPHPLFLSFLYQNDGSIYNEDNSRCVLNSSRSIDAFTQMTDMYTKYKVTLKMDMLTRFRTGETPIVITG